MGLKFGVLAIIIILDWCHACDPILDNSTIIGVNCTGVFTLRSVKGMKTLDCDSNVTLDLCGPIEIISKGCRMVHLTIDCPPAKDPFPIQVALLWVGLFLCCILLSIITLIVVGMVHLVKESQSFKIDCRGIKVVDDKGSRLLSYWIILTLVLSCNIWSSKAAICVDPHSADLSGPEFTYKFWLVPGSSACFRDGVVSHITSDTSLETNLMYKTANWKHFTWSKQACGMGDCGTKEECAVFGDHGKIIQGSHPRHWYKKYCKTIIRPWAFCFHMWGCWLMTNEISWKEEDVWDVKTIGDPDIIDDYEKSGLEDCQISILDQPMTTMKGNFLISKGQEAKICKSAAEEGFPIGGKLGDLQIFNDSDPIFDYDSFQCDMATSFSSGDCRVRASAMSVISSRCLELPTNVEMEHLWYDGSELHSTPLNAREFRITCKTNKTVKISDHNCHSLEISVEGIKQEQDFMFVSFKADSPNSSSVYPINESCHLEKLEIPCDGKRHIIRAFTYPLENCFPSDASFTDKSISPEVPSWIWDHTSHEVFGASGSVKSIIIYVACIAGAILLLRFICSR